MVPLHHEQSRFSKKNGPSREGPICLGSLWLGEGVADALVRTGLHLAILSYETQSGKEKRVSLRASRPVDYLVAGVL